MPGCQETGVSLDESGTEANTVHRHIGYLRNSFIPTFADGPVTGSTILVHGATVSRSRPGAGRSEDRKHHSPRSRLSRLRGSSANLVRWQEAAIAHPAAGSEFSAGGWVRRHWGREWMAF